jgi:hypothetical protein
MIWNNAGTKTPRFQDYGNFPLKMFPNCDKYASYDNFTYKIGEILYDFTDFWLFPPPHTTYCGLPPIHAQYVAFRLEKFQKASDFR